MWKIIYNLEFQLLCVSKSLELPINPDVLDINSAAEVSSKASAYNNIIGHSKVYVAELQS